MDRETFIAFVHDLNQKQPEGMRKSEEELDELIDAYFDKYGEPKRRQSKAA